MKSLRKRCIRCKEPYDYSRIDYDKRLYHCAFCDSVSSIVEERDIVKHQFEEKDIEGIEHYFEGSNLVIKLGTLSTGETAKSIIGIFFFWIILTGVVFFFSTTAAMIVFILGFVAMILVMARFYHIENRTYEIELTPYKVYFYEYFFGKRSLLEIASYEIDRIRVITQKNETVSGINRTDFIICKKDYIEIKPFYHSTDTEPRLIYLKSLIDNYLNIQLRESDVQYLSSPNIGEILQEKEIEN